MAYVNLNSEQVPRCELVRREAQQRTMGDLTSGFTSLANSLGMKPAQLLLVGVGALLLGWAAHSFVIGVGKAIQRKKVAFKRRAREAKSSAFVAQNPMWQTLLLVAVTGGAVYYLTTRNNGGPRA